MRAGDLLRRWDERLLPRLAGTVTRLGEGPGRPRVLTTAALLSCAAVLLAAVLAAEDRPTGDRTVGEVTRAGVADGDSIPGYVRAAAADLAALPPAAPAAGDGTYRTGCACLYAAVVRAEPVAPRGVAARPEVRAVDPAPEVSRLDRTVFTPLLPEQREVARPPADAGLAPEPTAGGRGHGTPGAATPAPTVGETSEPAPQVTDSSPVPVRPAPGRIPSQTPPTSAEATAGGTGEPVG